MRSAAARGLRQAAPVFAALGDEVRLRMVARLCDEGPLSITKLAEDSGVTRQAIAKHLRVLEDAGVVKGEREGRERLWTLEPARLEEARRQIEFISSEWDKRLGRLKAFVERGPRT
jgi:DNA-binding transcriptional ArsR family regulator